MDRGLDTTNALTEVRAVLSSARTALYKISGDLDDEDAAEMTGNLFDVVDLLDKWGRTGILPKSQRCRIPVNGYRYCTRPTGHEGRHNSEGIL